MLERTPAARLGAPAPLQAPMRAGLAIWAALGLALLICGAMTRPVTYDEDQYIAAAALTGAYTPYIDFAYLQPPLYPLLLAPAMALSGGWHVLAARTATLALALCSALLLWHLVRRLGAGRGLAVLLLTACLASPFLLAPLANARNDALPLTLLLAGLAAHLRAEAPPTSARAAVWLPRFAAALLFGLAAEAKLSYLFAPAALGLHALLAPRRRLPPAALAFALAALPAAILTALAPQNTLFGLVRYHLRAPVEWYTKVGQAASLAPPARLSLLADNLTFGGNLTLLLLAAALSLVAARRKQPWHSPGPMLCALTAGALALGFLPAPSQVVYYAPLAPLLACCIAHLEGTTAFIARAERKPILLAAATLPLAPVLALQLLELPKLANPADWIGLATHRNAESIRNALAAHGHPGGQVATLFPMYVIDANPIRPDLATGPFIYRSGPVIPPAEARTLHALTPETTAAALDADPPAAIYTGLYPGAWPIAMDAPLAAYAQSRHWPLVQTDALGGHLWVRPAP